METKVFSILWINVLSFILKTQISYLLNQNLKQGIQEFHRKYVLVPADKAANNVVVVCRLHYIYTLKQEPGPVRLQSFSQRMPTYEKLLQNVGIR